MLGTSIYYMLYILLAYIALAYIAIICAKNVTYTMSIGFIPATLQPRWTILHIKIHRVREVEYLAQDHTTSKG